MRIVGLDHVVLRCRNLEEMLHFYVEVLGCCVARSNKPLGLIHLKAGTALIDLVDVNGELGRAGGTPPSRDGHNMDHFCLRIEPFEPQGLRERFRRHGIELSEIHNNYGAEGYGWAFYLSDPEGNRVELKGPSVDNPSEVEETGGDAPGSALEQES